jgi:hypothetical protein
VAEIGGEVTFISGVGTSFIQCDLPASPSDGHLVLIVAFVDYKHLSSGTTMNAPSGWAGSSVTSTSGMAIYTHDGGLLGQVAITFTGNPVVASAVCFSVSDTRSVSPFTLGSSASTGGILHTLNSLTTAPFPNSIFIGAIMTANNNTSFDLANANAIAQLEGPMTILCLETGNPLDPLDCQPHFGSNALSVGWITVNAAGQTGSIRWNSRSAINPTIRSANGFALGMWVSPSQAPGASVFTSPTAGSLYAIGRTIPVAFTHASDPNVASSLLTYDLEYTLNGNTWNALTTTAPGVVTYNWNTAGLTPSTSVQLRVRADNGTEVGPWAYSGVITLLADAAPLAPMNVSPSGVVNQAEDLTVTFTFNDPGDLQKTLEIQWSLNADMSSPSTTGTVTTAVASHTFTGGTDILATPGPVYYRVRNQGIVDSTNGAWSAIKLLQVTVPISAPNITSPTAGSPPTAGTVTATFTGTGHVKIQYRIEEGGFDIYTSGEIFTSGNSFTLGISLANTHTYTLNLKRAASDGLWSTDDSETFTVSYTGPAQPVLTVTPIDEAGYVQIIITNSDTIAYQELYVDDVLVSLPLPADTVFNYGGAKSGIEHTYRVRAYKVTTLGFTDSDEETATLNLSSVFIFEPTKDLTTANFVATPIPLLAESNEPELSTNSVMVRLRKRVKQVAHFGRGHHRVLNYSIIEPSTQNTVINQIESWLVAGATLCVRDNRGERVFGKITSIVPTDYMNRIAMPLQIKEDDYSEAIE